jgi:hypothetical protein
MPHLLEKLNIFHEEGTIMPTELTKPEELTLYLSDEQKAQLVEFIGRTKHVKLDIDIQFEVDVERRMLAPVTVLVGNAI